AYNSPIVTDRFFNWIAVDKTNGDVGIVYYDSRLDSIDNRLVDVFFSHSIDGGDSYRSRRISTASFDPHITTSDRVVENIVFKFFGDYIGVAPLNRHWHAVWTDTRVTPDQDIYTADIRPYRPHGVDNLTVEETGEEFATIRWSYDPQTTFGYPLANFQFKITRDDGAVTLHDANLREWEDQSVEWLKRYTYTVTVISDGEESIGRNVRFIPVLVRKPKQVDFTTSRASADGFSLTMRIPDKNEYNRDLEGLDSLYVLIDDQLVEVLPVSDIYKGTLQERFYTAGPGKYHLVKAVISTITEGFRTFSDTTVAWLWSGSPQEDYDNDFEGATNIFTTNAWSLTNLEPFTSKVLNDSLPNVNYTAGYNSWFMLPSIRIGDATKTVEFDHIALVAPVDVAIVEVSRDNGISFEPVGQFTVNTRDAHWNETLSQSQMYHELLSLHRYIDSTVNIRFRLVGSLGGMDGWFIDNIALTDALSVERLDGVISAFYPNPLRVGASARLSIELPRPGLVTVQVLDMIGRVVLKRSVLAHGKDFEIPLSLDQAGSYAVSVRYENGDGAEISRHRFVVIP
ncbi:MAG TPA: hypothetical protein VFH43_08875, partial [Candidatus Kapabacteria bacterium]|nr:hypothetical protein [Candidatus Kapabacteria bacterium]